MLKDIFAKFFEQDSKVISDKILNSLADGYVDVKAYRDTEDGKELVYHDTGDNVVTNWMRQAIMMMLAGYSYSNDGTDTESLGDYATTGFNNISYPFDGVNEHEEKATNSNGYILNGEQYLWGKGDFSGHPTEPNRFISSSYKFPYFPTKVLFGTGKEYASWNDLETENQFAHTSWYNDIKEMYGGDQASSAFESLRDLHINSYSGTVGVGGSTTGNANTIRTVTVNDPVQTSDTTSTSDMASRYGVVGAVKTVFVPNSKWPLASAESAVLDSITSDAGKLIKSNLRGAGKPCFIYFNRTKDGADKLQPDWSDTNSAQIYLTKDATSSKFLNRITFRITMPSQSAGSGYMNQYYPYNGYTLKQIGLFNDARLAYDTAPTEDGVVSENMPCGMLLAIKNIEAFTKTADEMIVLTWTLTI